MSIFSRSKPNPPAERAGETIPTRLPDGQVKKKMGKVYIATDSGNLVPADKMKSIQKSSKQLKKDNLKMGDMGLSVKPYNENTFLELYESNQIYSATVKQIARDVAGLGWKLKLREGKKENQKERDEIEAFLNHPNEKNQKLRKIFEALIVDWGIYGNSPIEVVRNTGGKVSEIYRVPGASIWIHKDESKFCQKRDIKNVWFKQFGDEKNINMWDGKEGEFGDNNANEMIRFKNDSPRSDYYGMPNILSAVGSVFSLIGIRDFNLSFFTNYGIPSYLVTLEGEWPDGSDKKVTDYLNNMVKGSNNAHKTLVFTVPEGCKATFTPLSTNVKEGSFNVYKQSLTDDVLAAYSMPGYRIGINPVGKLGGTNSREATEIYKNGVVEPLQLDIESIINDDLIKEGMGFESYEFKFNDLDVRDLTAEIERYNKLIEHGVMTPNQAIKKLGLGETYPEGNRYYLLSGLIEIGEDVNEKG